MEVAVTVEVAFPENTGDVSLLQLLQNHFSSEQLDIRDFQCRWRFLICGTISVTFSKSSWWKLLVFKVPKLLILSKFSKISLKKRGIIQGIFVFGRWLAGEDLLGGQTFSLTAKITGERLKNLKKHIAGVERWNNLENWEKYFWREITRVRRIYQPPPPCFPQSEKFFPVNSIGNRFTPPPLLIPIFVDKRGVNSENPCNWLFR